MQNIKETLAGILLLILVAFGLIGFFGTCKFINPGERGVKVTLGKISPKVYEEGIHFVTPFISSITKWNVQTKTVNILTEVKTKDIQVAKITYALTYHLNPEQVVNLQREVGKEFYPKLIAPVTEGIIRNIIGKQNAAELIVNQALVSDQIRVAVKNALNKEYFEVTDFNITQISYGSAFMKAIEDKVTAEQEALKAKNKTVQVQEEAKQKILTAEAEAKAIQLKAQALAGNKQLVELEYAKKWDGKLPVNMYGNGAVPFVNVNGK